MSDAAVLESGVTAVDVGDVERDPLQDELLADGTITDAEMERALLAVVSCVENVGYDAELVSFEPGGRIEFQTSGSTSEEAAAADTQLTRCQSALLSEVESTYAQDNTPSEQELQAEEQRILDCLEALGNDVDGLSLAAASEQVPLPDFAECEGAG